MKELETWIKQHLPKSSISKKMITFRSGMPLRSGKESSQKRMYALGLTGAFLCVSGILLTSCKKGMQKLPGILMGSLGMGILLGNGCLYKKHIKHRKRGIRT